MTSEVYVRVHLSPFVTILGTFLGKTFIAHIIEINTISTLSKIKQLLSMIIYSIDVIIQ